MLCELRRRSCAEGGVIGTRLYFGSEVVPVTDPRSGRKAMGLAFQLALGLHKVYSRLLLEAAGSRVLRGHEHG